MVDVPRRPLDPLDTAYLNAETLLQAAEAFLRDVTDGNCPWGNAPVVSLRDLRESPQFARLSQAVDIVRGR